MGISAAVLNNPASWLNGKKPKTLQKQIATDKHHTELSMQDVLEFSAQAKQESIQQMIQQIKEDLQNQAAQTGGASGHDAWTQAMEAEREQIARIRRAFGLNDRDNVQVILVCKNSRIRPQSFITRPTTSPRAEQLSRQVRSNEARLRQLETGIDTDNLTDQERRQSVNALRQAIRDSNRALNRERARIATLPRSGFIVAVRDETS